MSQINITVGEFISAYNNIIGSDEDSQCAYDVINRARITAYPIGDWVGTMVHRPISVNNCSFILPYDLETIKQAKNFNGRSIGINSLVSREEFCSCNDEVLVRIDGRLYIPFQLTEKQPFSMFAVNAKDKGHKVRVSYLDWSGTMHDEEIELLHNARSQVKTRYIPKSILRITKGRTYGMVGVCQGSNKTYLAPEDKVPSFTVYCADVKCNPCIVVFAKKKYIPYDTSDAGTVLDINPEALSSLIVAIKVKDSRKDGWTNEYAASVKFAKDFLNTELNNEKSTSIGIKAVDFTDGFADSLNNLNS